jgi:two-component system chemotaxis response regulator CheB
MPNSKQVKHLVVIASSTGGPKSLQSVVPKLPANLNAAVIIVQHMPSGFTKSLASRLDDLGEIAVKEAEHGEILMNGQVYIAKGGWHLRVCYKRNDYVISLSDEPPREGVRPCANYTYESLIDTPFERLVGVVMTGMGADGTEGIRNLKKAKNMYTIAQNQESCIIYGMPRMVVEAGLDNCVLPLDEIADEIIKKVGVL